MGQYSRSSNRGHPRPRCHEILPGVRGRDQEENNPGADLDRFFPTGQIDLDIRLPSQRLVGVGDLVWVWLERADHSGSGDSFTLEYGIDPDRRSSRPRTCTTPGRGVEPAASDAHSDSRIRHESHEDSTGFLPAPPAADRSEGRECPCGTNRKRSEHHVRLYRSRRPLLEHRVHRDTPLAAPRPAWANPEGQGPSPLASSGGWRSPPGP